VRGFKVVIPARHAATRLPGKPLLDIGGRTLIQRVVGQALASAADEVLVATDDERIVASVAALAGPRPVPALMTAPELPSGTDRVAAVAAARGWPEDMIVVNVQGDEPFLPAVLIDEVAELLARDAQAALATLAVPMHSLEEFLDPNVVKVVRGADGRALYFSRAPVPWSRDGAPDGRLAGQREYPGALRHLGIYAYRVGALRRIVRLPPSPLEQTERLEQLRALEHGLPIAVGIASTAPGPGIDTPTDLERARRLVAAGEP
jgi:3-deoxy-manno-octulosonate cytidylyltransferase (CMP-KDO synthetase)